MNIHIDEPLENYIKDHGGILTIGIFYEVVG